MNIYALIMAGGVGERFWPRSRKKSPKQLLKLVDPQKSMLCQTVERIAPLVPKERVLVLTNDEQRDAVCHDLPDVPKDNVIAEPLGRNTAPCIGFAAQWINHKDPNSLMIVLPADHSIADEDRFIQTLHAAIDLAKRGYLTTLGITPKGPETGYGYIEAGKALKTENLQAFEVCRFKEKPQKEQAEQFLKDGKFFWNSGMFVWSTEQILAQLQEHQAPMSELLQKIAIHFDGDWRSAMEELYPQMPKLPIDIAVMEKSAQFGKVAMVEADFAWDDLGQWTALERVFSADYQGNIAVGSDVQFLDAAGNIVQSDTGMVGVLGVSDLVIVRSGDSVLVAHKSQAERVKELLAGMHKQGLEQYL